MITIAVGRLAPDPSLKKLRARARSSIRPALEALATALRERGCTVTTTRRGRGLLYRSSAGRIGNISIEPFSLRPTTVRIAINHFDVLPSARAARSLGVKRDRLVSRSGESLELTCLPSELEALAGWLPGWLDARTRGSSEPRPHVVMSRPGEPVRSYVWTRAATDAYAEARRAEQARLATSRGVIGS